MARKTGYNVSDMIAAIDKEIGVGDDEIDVINDEPSDQPPPVEAPPPVPEPEKPVDPPATEEEKPTEPVAAKPSFSDEYSTLNARLDYLQGTLNKVSQPAQPEPATPKPLREITDESEYAQRIEAMERTAAASYSAIKSLELQNAQRAIAELQQELPDLAKHIPMDQVMRGIDQRIQNGSVGADWKEPLLKVYDVVTGGSRFQSQAARIKELEAELAKKNDELAQRRADREAKAQELKTAGMVPTGGSVYQHVAQPDVPKVSAQLRGKRAYDAVGKAMEQALANLGG